MKSRSERVHGETQEQHLKRVRSYVASATRNYSIARYRLKQEEAKVIRIDYMGEQTPDELVLEIGLTLMDLKVEEREALMRLEMWIRALRKLEVEYEVGV